MPNDPSTSPDPGPGPTPPFLLLAGVAIISAIIGGIVGYLLHG